MDGFVGEFANDVLAKVGLFLSDYDSVEIADESLLKKSMKKAVDEI